MFWTILFIILFVTGMHFVYRDNNDEVVAWRQGKYGKAIWIVVWGLLKVFIFFFFAPILIFFWIFR